MDTKFGDTLYVYLLPKKLAVREENLAHLLEYCHISISVNIQSTYILCNKELQTHDSVWCSNMWKCNIAKKGFRDSYIFQNSLPCWYI
jgi:hypothetical protein